MRHCIMCVNHVSSGSRESELAESPRASLRQLVVFGYVVTGPERGGVTYLSRGGKYIAYNFHMTSLCELGALQAAVGVKVIPLALWLQC
jgi:hypothetical protein